mmetsp:Transcript_15583/g.40157  ORF Transcript_15583/g.40157 Transcript_15583/m.40157 type:complete len:200 (+) Transcript_15583:306-905(+)
MSTGCAGRARSPRGTTSSGTHSSTSPASREGCAPCCGRRAGRATTTLMLRLTWRSSSRCTSRLAWASRGAAPSRRPPPGRTKSSWSRSGTWSRRTAPSTTLRSRIRSSSAACRSRQWGRSTTPRASAGPVSGSGARPGAGTERTAVTAICVASARWRWCARGTASWRDCCGRPCRPTRGHLEGGSACEKQIVSGARNVH